MKTITITKLEADSNKLGYFRLENCGILFIPHDCITPDNNCIVTVTIKAKDECDKYYDFKFLFSYPRCNGCSCC